MAKQKGATPRKQTDGMSIVAAMLVGGLMTVGIGFFLYLWNPFNHSKAPAVANDTPTVRQKVQASSTPKPNYEFYDLLPDQKITGLPKQAISDVSASAVNTNVTPDVVVANKTKSLKVSSSTGATSSPAITAETAAKPRDHDNQVQTTVINSKNKITLPEDQPTERTYILQINSFTNADDADRRRARVLMAGVDAQIAKKQIPDGMVVYQVISRPMTSQTQVAEAQARLQENGIDSLIVEQRHTY